MSVENDEVVKAAQEKAAEKLAGQIVENIGPAVGDAIKQAFDRALNMSDQEIAKKGAQAPVKPGQIIPGTRLIKKPWTYKDLEEAHGIATFMPNETVPVTVNGVTVQMFDGIEVTCPKCFKDVLDRHQARNRQNSRGDNLSRRGVTKSTYGGEL